MIEVEKRVLVDKSELNDLIEDFNKEGTLTAEFKRFTIVKITNSDFTPNKENPIDLKIRTTKDESLFTIKKGNWHSDSARQENEIHFQKEEIKELIHMANSLDFNYFVVTYVTRKKFKLDKFVVTVDEYHHMQECMIEVELLVQDESEVDSAEKEIAKFLEVHSLKPLNSEATVDFISKMNMIKETQIDFTKESVEDWFSKWKEFINCNI